MPVVYDTILIFRIAKHLIHTLHSILAGVNMIQLISEKKIWPEKISIEKKQSGKFVRKSHFLHFFNNFLREYDLLT